jgi:UDP-N-acetylglucosamine--N-acetylmuramyl-(pentapeptide) pyrophosphoryl-undecaprenol N-acetylglucosamine transferase
VVVPDGDCSGRRLGDELSRLLDTPGALDRMAAAAASAGHRDAADRVAELLDEHRRG